MGRSLVSLGANIGDPLSTLGLVADELRQYLGCSAGQFRLSPMFRTPPVGGPSGQPPFVNAVAAIESEIDVWELWAAIRDLEHRFGRERNLRWEARKIDLDILLCNGQRIWTPHLKIPHPRMCMRRFILVPAKCVAADWIDPVTGKSIAELAQHLEVGAANLVLVSNQPITAVSMLEETARLAVANWINPSVCETTDQRALAERLSNRWVSTLTLDAVSDSSLMAATKLAVFLADPTPSADVAWEDYHRQLACQLNLSPGPAHQICLNGPRYLLATDRPAWAVHELVAALEAMDCPIEPIH